ncbi:MAG TPA: sugar phosphate isomerase/epimerase family protein [Phycisphaerae bacterium]|nr:sugar phosphate isomerase/epimerase family protein [Phycisphaerae bacterium]
MATHPHIPAALSLDGLNTDARGAFDLAAEAGYEGIAFATNHPELTPGNLGESARRHVKKLLEARRLAIASVRAAAPRTGLADAATIDRTVDNARTAIRLAHDLGVGTVALNIGNVAVDGAGEAAAVGALRELAGHADAAGVTLALGAETAGSLEKLLAQVNFDRARANLDTARMIAAGEDPLPIAEALAARVGQFTAGDAVRAGKSTRSAFLGEGQLPLVELLEILGDIGFHGPTVVDVRDLADAAGGARHAAAVLEKAWLAVRR